MQVSKRLLQNGSLCFAAVLVFSLLGAGIFGVFEFKTPDTLASFKPALNTISSSLYVTAASIDYTRPSASDNFAIGSGGPLLTEVSGSEDAEIEKQLKAIQLSGNPAYIPSIWAHSGKINNEFGFRRNPFGGRTYEFHSGLDIDGERGDLIVAPAAGTVVKASYQGGYGNLIEIDHGNGLTTLYGHLAKIDVEAGNTVTRGQVIGQVGSTGRSTGPHLHYELRLGERAINPRRFLPPEPTELKRIVQ